MPVYLFTYHAYGSWMPDRPQGYVRRREGILPTDEEMARVYRQDMPQDAVLLSEAQQRLAIEALLTTAGHIDATLHAIASEPTHLHILASWRDERTFDKVSVSLKRGITITLQRAFGKQRWLSRDFSRKRVEDREHFDHLVTNYFPKHSGWNWNQQRGYFKTSAG